MLGSNRPRVDFHQGTLRLFHITQQQISQDLAEFPLQADPRAHCFRCDAMFAGAIRERLLIQHDEQFDWHVGPKQWQWTPRSDAKTPALRSDQREAVDAFHRGGRRGLIVMPTGTGKTVVAIELIRKLASSTLVVVPVRDLMYQWHQRILETMGVDAGLIGDGVRRVSPISVTTYDSAAIHMPRIGDRFRMIVFDEVHHLSGNWRSDAARMSTADVRLGLTATPPSDRERIRLLHHLVGPTLYQQSIREASGKTLADYVVRRIVVTMSVDEAQRYREVSKIVQQFVYEQRQTNPRFQWQDTYKLTTQIDEDRELAVAANQALQAFRIKRRLEEQAEAKLRVLEDLFRLHAGEGVIVFTGSNAMARNIALRFLVPCLLSHCAKQERRELLEGFAAGRYPVLIANRVLDEGIDLPEVNTAIVLGGMASTRQAIQRLGRVLRKNRSGQPATLYEVVTDATKEVQRSRDRRRNEAYRSR